MIVFWQWILVVLWATTAGVLGGEAGTTRNDGLTAGMVVALVAMVAWFIGGTMGVVGCCCAGRCGRKEGSVI